MHRICQQSNNEHHRTWQSAGSEGCYCELSLQLMFTFALIDLSSNGPSQTGAQPAVQQARALLLTSTEPLRGTSCSSRRKLFGSARRLLSSVRSRLCTQLSSKPCSQMCSQFHLLQLDILADL